MVTPTALRLTAIRLSPGHPGVGHWAAPHYEAFRAYLEGATKSLAFSSVRNYLSDLGTLWRFLDERGITSLAVDRDTITGYLAWLREPRNGAYARGSLMRRISGLRQFFKLMAKRAHIERNPMLRVANMKPVKRLPRYLDEAQAKALVEAVEPDTPEGLRDRAMLELLYACGLRVSELVGLDKVSIDLDKRWVRVIGKGDKERMVPFGKPAQRALQDYLKNSRSVMDRGRTDALFIGGRTWKGKRLTVRSVQKLVKRTARVAHLPDDVHPHTIRHTTATHLLDGGADLLAVAAVLGHVNIATTELYTHVSQAKQRAAYFAAHPRNHKPDATPAQMGAAVRQAEKQAGEQAARSWLERHSDDLRKEAERDGLGAVLERYVPWNKIVEELLDPLAVS